MKFHIYDILLSHRCQYRDCRLLGYDAVQLGASASTYQRNLQSRSVLSSKWRLQVPLKCWYLCTKLYDVTFQNTIIFKDYFNFEIKFYKFINFVTLWSSSVNRRFHFQKVGAKWMQSPNPYILFLQGLFQLIRLFLSRSGSLFSLGSYFCTCFGYFCLFFHVHDLSIFVCIILLHLFIASVSVNLCNFFSIK
jgi:hypothetical protein